MNLMDLFIGQVNRVPDRLAIVSESGSVTFAELEQRSNDLALGFQRSGLKTGDYVLVLQPFGIPLYVTLLALFRMGAVAVFPDAAARASAISDCCDALPIRGFSGGWKAQLLRTLFPKLRAIPLNLSFCAKPSAGQRVVEDLPENHPALVTFTSGSTGRPKAIVRSHRFLLAQHRMIVDMLGTREDDISLVTLPVFILSYLASGVTSVIPAGNIRKPSQVDPHPLWRQLDDHNINTILMPPALCQRLVRTTGVWPHVRNIFTGGGPVFPDLLKDLSRRAPHAAITSVYGSTEAEPIAHIALSDISPQDLEQMKAGAGLLVGKPVSGIKIKIIDDEICVTGDHVVKGYLNASDNSSTKIIIAGDVWHKTGDAGCFDAQGRLWLLGRLEARHADHYPFCIETAARLITNGRTTAFLHHKGRNILVVETGIDSRQTAILRTKFPDCDIIEVGKIPLDRRHNSKIDYGRLRILLDQRNKRRKL